MHLNHVANLVARHVGDRVSIKILQKGKEVAHTDFELALIGLAEGKTKSFVAIATGSQLSSKAAAQYYRIELDLQFRARNSRGPRQSPLEMAIENYKLMMGKSKLTPMELAILEMMIERQELAKDLTPARLRMRKARFFMRNLKRIEYKTLDGLRRVQLLVSPLTFLFQVFSASSFSHAYDHYRTQHLR